MGYVDSLSTPDPAQERRILRKQQQARREARFDNGALTPRDADDFARQAPSHQPLVRVYWKEYGAELRKQRGKN